MSSEPTVYLPEDLVVHVARHAAVEDIFSLKQTCRSIYASVNADYLWHQILPREDIPLATPLHRDILSYSAAEIQSHVLRALRLRSNWSQDLPTIKKWASPKLEELDGSHDILKLVNNGSILVAIKRNRYHNASMTVSALLLEDIQNPRLLVHYTSPVLLKQYEATIDEAGKSLLLAAAVSKGNTEVLQIYRSLFAETAYSISTFEMPYEFELKQQGLFHKVSLQGTFVASVIMGHVPEGANNVSSILLANWETGNQITLFPPLNETIRENMDIKIIYPYLVIIAACNTELRVILVPIGVIEHGSHLESPNISWKNRRTLPDFQSIKFPCMDFYEICISDIASVGSFPILSVIAFPSISRDDIFQSKKAMLLRIKLDTDSDDLRDYEHRDRTGLSGVMNNFDVRMESYPEYVSLGTTGRRAVWLEQSLKSDYTQVVRMSCSETPNDSPPSLKILIPPEPQLPFKPSACRALAFDEASGRVCLGSYKGELFILDYA
ncbi:hypothetical protein SCHPADRAFT_821770 [Schizopora paradoxa]|uniref:F-box domain-containing protein n=1 Tax=Schizopora paradoxa TaxID=27342 RepID=A0A0H2RZK1_9AGAM|nr:hypothetical protein SCHPADRAFT_821770 [Schizopora paradoxa]